MSRVVLVLGAGPRVGLSIAEKFHQAGYKVALASRTAKKHDAAFKHFTIDLEKPENVPTLFEQVKKELGPPSIVIYNASGSKAARLPGPFPVPLDTLNSDIAVSLTSPFYAAEESIKSFDELHTSGALGKEGATFIYTGNVLTVHPNHTMLSFGMVKSGGANMIQGLAEGKSKSATVGAYPDKPYKFYYGDQRTPEGGPMYTGLSGPAHADQYFLLSQEPKQQAWTQTFVEGKGYVKFD